MDKEKNKNAIDERYSSLAGQSCCLSCGGALDYATPSEGEICVDLGSGRGQDVLRMAEDVGPNGFAYGIDVSSGMLDKARRNAQKLGVENVKFVESEFENIQLPSSHVDLVLSNCSINHARDKNAVWSEIFRILKPGGRFTVSDIYSLEDVPAHYSNDPKAVAECWAGAVKKDMYMETLLSVGLTEIQILEESVPYEKGKIKVASFTVCGVKPKARCCCSGGC